MKVRLFTSEEPWPAGLNCGFEQMPRQFVQHDWIFVAEDTQVQGMLVTTPAHGLVILMRCQVRADAPTTTLNRLLRGAFAELKQRGYHLWATVLDPTERTERELYRIGKHWGGAQWPSPSVVMVGLTSKRDRRAA